MNAEQASKRLTQEPTRRVIGRAAADGTVRANEAHQTCRGNGDSKHAKLTSSNTGSPSGGGRCHQPAARESQAGPFGVTERLVGAMKPGNAGRAKEPLLKGNARSNEGGGIGVEPNNPRKRSEVADSVARQSEGIAQLSLLCLIRQGASQGRSGIRLRVVQSQLRSSRSRRLDVRRHRDVRSRALAGGTGASAEKPNLSTTSCAASLYTEAGRETAAASGARYP